MKPDTTSKAKNVRSSGFNSGFKNCMLPLQHGLHGKSSMTLNTAIIAMKTRTLRARPSNM